MLLYLIISIIPFNPVIQEAEAAINKNDIYTGIGVAVLLLLLSKLGESMDKPDKKIVTPPPTDDNRDDTGDIFAGKDVEYLARIIYAEARGEPYEGQVAVAAVVLNRVESRDFPNDIKSVLYQPGQFATVEDGQINLTPGATAYNAAEDALNGEDPSFGALYFYNPEKAKTLWWLSTREITTEIGAHVFAR